LKELNMYSCRTTSHAVEVLSDLVRHVRGPEAQYLETSCDFLSDDSCYDSDADASADVPSDEDDPFSSDQYEEGDEDEEDIYDDDEEDEEAM
jgi:hypothetical protein